MTPIEQELTVILSEVGSIEPSHVVDWARVHPESELHKQFEWDDAVAAEEYRIYQARWDIVSERASVSLKAYRKRAAL